MKKWQARLLIALTLALLATIWLMTPPSWPPKEPNTLSLKGPQRNCKITTDTFNVPHIKADTDEAMMFCWGFVQARARAWQMDFLRRVAYGRLSEQLGQDYLKTDFFMKLMDFQTIAARWLAHAKKHNTQSYRWLQHYTQGVNEAFKRIYRTKSLPYQAKRYGLRLVPWRVLDTYMVSLLQSFNQTRKTLFDDLKHARYRVQMGNKRYKELFPVVHGIRPFDHTIIKPGEHPLAPRKTHKGDEKKTKPSTRPSSQPTSKPASSPTTQPKGAYHQRNTPSKWAQSTPTLRNHSQQYIEWLRRIQSSMGRAPARGMGSNNWVIAPTRSLRGHALLANDPHLVISTPSFWHEVHLNSPNFDVLGINVPGVPVIASGNNRHVAWGVTNGYSNVGDLIKLPASTKETFMLGKQKVNITSFRPVVWLKKAAIHIPIFWKTFKRTKLGPIFPIKGPKGEQLLLRWSAYDIKRSPFEAGFRVMSAKNARQIDEGFKLWSTPCWNFVFADKKGNIGYRQVGLIPKRKRGQRGLADAQDPAQQWDGYFDHQHSPTLYNPKRGFIATANNRVFPSGFPYFADHAFSSGHRAKRIEARIKQLPRHTLHSIKNIQLDILSPHAVLALPKMLRWLSKHATRRSKQAAEAIRILQQWDKHAHREKLAPTIFRVWFERMHKQMFKKDRVKPGISAILRVWNGTITAGNDKPMQQIVHEAFQHTLKKLTKELGPNIKHWTWSRYHKHHFRSVIKSAQTWSPTPQGAHGDDHTVNVAPNGGKGPYNVKIGASYRFVIELGERFRSYGVLAGKQVDKEPKLLGRQQKMWLDHQYRKRPFYPDEIKANKKHTETISF